MQSAFAIVLQDYMEPVFPKFKLERRISILADI